jgi:hypothetical protein
MKAMTHHTRYTEGAWWISPRLGPICDELTASPRLRNVKHDRPSRGIQMLIVMHMDTMMLQYRPTILVREVQARQAKLPPPP